MTVQELMKVWLFLIFAWLCTLFVSIGLMAVAHAQNTVQIYQFNPATLPLSGQELVPLSQNGNTVQTTISVLGTAPFTSIAAVEAAAIPAGAVVCRNGYAMGGDSPEVCYTASNTNCTLHGGAGDGGAQLPRYGGGCLNLIPPNTVSVSIWFGAPNGTLDNTAAIQAAVSYLCSGTKGTLLLPGALQPYVINAATGVTACGGVNLVGQGQGSLTGASAGTVIKVIGTGSVPIVNWPGTDLYSGYVNYTLPGSIQNIGFYFQNSNASVTQTGPAFEFQHCRGCRATGISTWGAYQAGIIYAGFGNIIDHFNFDQMVAGGQTVTIYGDDQSGACDSNLGNCPDRTDFTRVEEGQANAAASSSFTSAQGILIKDFADTVWVRHTVLNQLTNPIEASCPTSGVIGACPQFIKLDRVEMEPNGIHLSGTNGIWMNDVTDVTISDPQIYGYTITNGILIGNANRFSSNNILIEGGKINNTQNSCIDMQVASALQIHNMKIVGCGQGGTGWWGVEVHPQSGSYKMVDISHNMFCTELGTTPANPMKAIGFFPSAGDYLSAMGNNFMGCASGVTDSSGGSHNVIANNVGP